MAEVVLFHHVQGLTEGVRRLAAELRAAGHTVHAPDFLDGATYASIDEGFAAVKAKGPGAHDAWADEVVAQLPAGLVYLGISLGVMPAQRLAQTRPGAAAAVLLEACVPPSEFGSGWPDGVPVQVHGMERDPFFGLEGDLDPATCTCSPTPRCRRTTRPRPGSSSSARWACSPASDRPGRRASDAAQQWRRSFRTPACGPAAGVRSTLAGRQPRAWRP